MNLTTEFGRFDRAAVSARAQEIHRRGASWQQAMSEAWGEASAELRARFRRGPTLAIRHDDNTILGAG